VVDRTSVRFGGSFRTGLPNRTEPNQTDFPPNLTCSENFEPLKNTYFFYRTSLHALSTFVLHPEESVLPTWMTSSTSRKWFFKTDLYLATFVFVFFCIFRPNMLVVYEVAVRIGSVRSVRKKYVVRFGSANPRFGRPLLARLGSHSSLILITTQPTMFS
jgi:hypothetical protein